MDIAMLALALGFFGAALAYVSACNALWRSRPCSSTISSAARWLRSCSSISPMRCCAPSAS